jgi:hypothetical protein
MKDKQQQPKGRIQLRFRKGLDNIEAIRGELSTCVRADNSLFLAHDESNAIERLTWRDNKYKHHRRFALKDFIELYDKDEMDIESLAWEAPYLWLSGSMSTKRNFPDEDDSAAEGAEKLATINVDPNRYTVARIPCSYNAKNKTWSLKKEMSNPDKTAANRYLRPAVLDRGQASNILTELLRTDPHLGTHMELPCKENGFDVEGIAVKGDRIYFGLRGPVLRGWAVVVEIEVYEQQGVLRLKQRGKRDKPYNKHFINLKGMGIRELNYEKNDLHILAGPTMDLDGTISAWCVEGGLEQQEVTLTHAPKRLFDIIQAPGTPYGKDQAEGLAILENGDYLVVYDSPIEARFHKKHSYWASVFAR